MLFALPYVWFEARQIRRENYAEYLIRRVTEAFTDRLPAPSSADARRASEKREAAQ